MIRKKILLIILSVLYTQVDYNTEIQPILNLYCTNCHGGSGGLNLSSYDNLMNGGNSGQSVIPYDHYNSELYDRITRSESMSGDMPPSGSLDQSEIDLIAQWIDEGALEFPMSNSGCMDPLAYNCTGSNNGDYITDIGGIIYDFTCNGSTQAGSEDCGAGQYCEGYYNPEATSDDGSCRYYQAPSSNDVSFTVSSNGISLDWSSFIPPENSVLESYHVQRCVDQCTWITGFTPGDSNTGTSVFDEYNYTNGSEIKYAIAVKYSNNPYWGWAIGSSYVTPDGSCPELGDLNGDGGYNVLDIVALANCVLAGNCSSL